MASSPFPIHPATPERWPALEELFGPERGANSGCWCLWPRMPHKDWKAMPRDERKAGLRRLVEEGPPPGLLAYDGERAVGWCAVGPRATVARFDTYRVSAPPDATDSRERVFAITCFFIRTGYRGRGLMRLLAEAAADFARRQGAAALDVCAIDTPRKLVWGEGFVGVASVFRDLGWREIARRTPIRPLMRLELGQLLLPSSGKVAAKRPDEGRNTKLLGIGASPPTFVIPGPPPAEPGTQGLVQIRIAREGDGESSLRQFLNRRGCPRALGSGLRFAAPE